MAEYTDILAGEIVSLEKKVETLSPLLWQVVGENVSIFMISLVSGIIGGYILKKTGIEYGVFSVAHSSIGGVVTVDIGEYFYSYKRNLSKTIRNDIGTLAGTVIGLNIGYII